MKSVVNASRWIPPYMTEQNQHVNKAGNIEVFWCPETLVAMGFFGKSKQPSFYLRFKTYEKMEEYVLEALLKWTKINELTAQQKAKKKALNDALKAEDHFSVGDVIYNSWGYEQTNIEFYKVVAVSGKTIHVKEITYIQVEGSMEPHGMSCTVVAGEEFIEGGREFKLRIKAYSYGVSICSPSKNSYYSFSKWSGTPLYKSWYY